MGIGGAGVIGATGYGAYTLIKPKTIEDQLKWNSKDVLPTDADNGSRNSDWEVLVKDYEQNSNANKIDNMTLTAPTGSTDRSSNISQLKAKCKTLLDTELVNDADNSKYQLAEKWCTKKVETATAG